MTDLQTTIVDLLAARDRVEAAVLNGEPYPARAQFFSQAESVLASTDDQKTRDLVMALKREVEANVMP